MESDSLEMKAAPRNHGRKNTAITAPKSNWRSAAESCCGRKPALESSRMVIRIGITSPWLMMSRNTTNRSAKPEIFIGTVRSVGWAGRL
jgi:hypothetical protein